MASNIPIFYETLLVGEIEVSDLKAVFRYNEDWLDQPGAFPISILAPLGHHEVGEKFLAPWLSNLLPEGEALNVIGRNLGTSPQDVIGLLEQIGRDTAGALSIGRVSARSLPRYRIIQNDDDLERIINELPEKPFLAGSQDISMSLAGAQQKLPVVRVGDRIGIPLNGNPSTHILKPDNTRLFGSVQNEAFSLVLAKKVGLEASDVTTGVAGQRPYLLVTRYDRAFLNGRWNRLHQEDFCQALAMPPSRKYEHNQAGGKGPSLANMFAVIRQYASPSEIIKMFDAIVFNVMITNVDSYAKNYSMILRARGPSLAPLYDLMVGDAWDGITKNMAQDIGGQRRGGHVNGKHWKRLAAASGLNGTMAVQRVKSLATAVQSQIDSAIEAVRAMPAGGHVMLDIFGEAVKTRVRTIMVNVEHGLADDLRENSEPTRPMS